MAMKKMALRELVIIQSGQSPSSLQLSRVGGLPYVKVEDMNNCQKYQISSREYTNDGSCAVPKGSIIFPKRGAAIMNNKVRIAERELCMDTNMMAIIPNEKVLSEFLYYSIINAQLFKIADTSTIPQINNKHINPYKIILPTIEIQEKMVELLSIWDYAIEKTERLITAKEKQYLWLLSNLISNDKHQHVHIRDFAFEVSTRNNGTAIDLVLSVTNNRGFVLPSDQFERRVASSDLSNYKIVTRGQYAYNPSRINVGSIARLDGWDKGVLSPMYVVFELNEKKVNSDYFLHWLESHEGKEHIRNSAQGSVRETVSFTDFGAISFPLPSINEQGKIAAVLNMARNEIDLIKRQLEACRQQKRGLMQKLLTGQWRVKTNTEEM